jgi:hypothetical protein
MQIPKHFALLVLAFSLAACNSGANAQAKNDTDVSMDQLFQADLDKRPLTPHERSYLRGIAYGVFGYVAHQQLMGWSDHTFVCVDQSQRDSVTPEWLHKTMIQDVLDNPALSSYNASIVAAYTLSKHFPCKNSPKYNPDGFTDAVEFLRKAASTDER